MVDAAHDARVGFLPAWSVDAATAALATFVAVISVWHIGAESGERPVDGLAVVVAAVAGGSLVLRRRAPLLALVIVAGALSVYSMRDYPGGPVYALGPIALFSYMIRTDRRSALVAAGAFGGAMVAARLVGGHSLGMVALIWVGWVMAPTLGSEVARGRLEQRRLAEARRRDAHQHEAETLRRQLVEERLRIARDLHDSVAHSMATINVQAGVAAHVIEQRPLAARDALEVIRVTSGEVLDELTAMLRLLRADTGDDDAGGDHAGGGDAGEGPGRAGLAPRQPTADLSRLEGLVASSRLAGLDVELLVGDVELTQVPPTISTSAYRIVQEALTNVIRHARTDRATVAVFRPPGGGLAVEVRDDGSKVVAAPVGPPSGRPPPGPGSGMGLVGIRERAEVTGGHAEFGPRPQGGFVVRVTWP